MKRLAESLPQMYRSVLAPSWLSSNGAWKTTPGGCYIHRRTYTVGVSTISCRSTLSHYLIHDSSSYELLALELNFIKPRGCRRANWGWREEGLSRDHLATGSVPSKLPPLSVTVCPSPVSREANRDFVELSIYVVTFQVPGI